MDTKNSNSLSYTDENTNCSVGPNIPLPPYNKNISIGGGCDCGNLNCKKYNKPNNIQSILFKDIEGFCGYGPEQILQNKQILARGCDCGNIKCGEYKTDNTIQNTLYQDIEGFCGYGPEQTLQNKQTLSRGCDCGNIKCGEYNTDNTIQNTLYQDIEFRDLKPKGNSKLVENFACGCSTGLRNYSKSCGCGASNCPCPGNCACGMGCRCRYCAQAQMTEGFRGGGGGRGGFGGHFGSDFGGSFEGRGKLDRYNFNTDYNNLENAPNTSSDADWDYSEYNLPYLSEDILEKRKAEKTKIEGFRGGGGGGGRGGGFGGRGGGFGGGFGGELGAVGRAGGFGGLRGEARSVGPMDSRFADYLNTTPNLNTYAYSTDGPGVSGGYVGFEPTDLPIYSPNYYMPYGYPNVVVDTPQQYLEDEAEEGIEPFRSGSSGGRSGGSRSGGSRSGGSRSGGSRSGGWSSGSRSGSPSRGRSSSIGSGSWSGSGSGSGLRSRSSSRSSSPSRTRGQKGGSYSGKSDRNRNKNVTINKYYNKDYPNDKPFNEPYPNRGTWKNNRYWPYGTGYSGYWNDWPYYASPLLLPAVIGSNYVDPYYEDDEPTTINNITINAQPVQNEENSSTKQSSDDSEEFNSMQEKILAQTEQLKSLMLNEIKSKENQSNPEEIAIRQVTQEQINPDFKIVHKKDDDIFKHYGTYIAIVVILIIFIFLKKKQVVA